LDLPLVELKDDNRLALLTPQSVLEPIEEPSQTEPVEAPPSPSTPSVAKPPPGDDTPTSAAPSPGRIGNDQPVDPSFDSNPPILYPPDAVRAGVEGTLLLRIRIAVDGRVIDVQLVHSSGSALLDRTAMSAVSTWHGRPAQIAGHAIEAAALLPVTFRLRGVD
jgi:protein TonB